MAKINPSPVRTADFQHGNLIVPSPDWTGVAGSGFGGAFGAVPVDPARLTAKPALRMLVPPKQTFTDLLLVGFAAAANNKGSLADDLGLAYLRLHYEGNTVDIDRPTWSTMLDANGNEVSYYGWWAWLRHSGTHGNAHVYAEAVPADNTMQSRVIGPFMFNPQAEEHDLVLTVEPSQPEFLNERYQTLQAAFDRAKALGVESPLIRIMESDSGLADGKYTLEDNGLNSPSAPISGWCTIEAVVPVVIGKSEYTTDAAALQRDGRLPWRLRGQNVTFDFLYVNEVFPGGSGIWYDGCKLTMGGEGRDQLRRGLPPFPNVWSTRHSNAYYTETTITQLTHPCAHALLARGVYMKDVSGDIFTDAHCVVACKVDGHSTEIQNTDRPAFTVTYTGPEATATLERAGGVAGFHVGTPKQGGVWTANWGSNSEDFATSTLESFYTGDAGDGYWMSDVVDWLNGLPGWSATLIDDRFAAVYGTLEGLVGRGFGPNSLNVNASGPNPSADVKDTVVTITAYYDSHGDWYQQNNMFLHENVIVYHNLAWEMEVQGIFLSPTGGTAANLFATEDYLFFSNCLHVREDPVGGWDADIVNSQLGRNDVRASHVVVAHNSLADQPLVMRTDSSNLEFDSYCLVANNVAKRLYFTGPADPNLAVVENHVNAGIVSPANFPGSSVGGDHDSYFVDARNGDFSPTAELLLHKAEPVLRFDPGQSLGASTSAKGAFREAGL